MKSADLALAGVTQARPARTLAAEFRAAAWRHRFLYTVALSSLTLATAVGHHTSNMPDFDVLRRYGFWLLFALWVGCCAFAVFHILWLGLVERSPSPTKAFFGSFARFFSDRARLANTLHGLAALLTFISAFSVLKGAIAILRPFHWDRTLSEWDRTLHFGRLPYEWFGWITEWPLAVFAINFAYHLWFVILLGLVLSAIITERDSGLRHRFLLGYMLLWLLGGFLVATGFSSAGPCYFARLGLGGDYQPLMDALEAASRAHPVWALDVQDALWDGFAGFTRGSIGISAFPSLHVGSSVLMTLYAGSRWHHAGPPLWLFTGVIMVGSVTLGWHYAVDGYAGALIAVAIWKALGRVATAVPTDGTSSGAAMRPAAQLSACNDPSAASASFARAAGTKTWSWW